MRDVVRSKRGRIETIGHLRKQGHLHETQLHLFNSTTSMTTVRTLQILIPRKEKRAERTHFCVTHITGRPVYAHGASSCSEQCRPKEAI